WKQSAPRENGVLLSPHNPGLSILIIPGFAAAGLLGAQVQLLVLAALTFSLTYLLVARTTGEGLWSWLATAAVALSASAFIYSTEVYPEVPTALLLVVSLLLVQGRSRISGWGALALAVTLSVMVWMGVKYAPLAALVALWALWKMDRQGRTVLLAAGMSSAVFFVWFHLRTFGAVTPYSVGIVYAGDTTLSVLEQHFDFAGRAYRLLGLFVDQRFGIDRWAPVFLLLVPGLALLWRHDGLARLVLVVILVQLLIATFVAITMMGWWFPGRTLMTVVPLFVLPLTLILTRMSWLGRSCFGLLAVYSIMVTISLAIAGHSGEVTIAVDPFNMGAGFFQAAAPLFPNYTFWDARTWLLTISWAVAALASVTVVLLPSGSLRLGSFITISASLFRNSGSAARSWYTAFKLVRSMSN
ncbi:MAG TPA: hypothetical protein VFA32_03615, partial [Dehalococcoidia bacterium]|nr:hypothetical protein [Dehalococcoidia bacterium]